MNTWLIVAVVVAVVAAALLAVLARRRSRFRRSAGAAPADPTGLGSGGPMPPGNGVEELPTVPVEATGRTGAPTPPAAAPEARTERIPVSDEPAGHTEAVEPTHVLPVVERRHGSAATDGGPEASRHARPDDQPVAVAPTANGGGGRHRADSEPAEPPEPNRLADHQRTEPHGGPVIPLARQHDRPSGAVPGGGAPGPVPVSPPGAAAGPPPAPRSLPLPRNPVPAAGELFVASTPNGAEDEHEDADRPSSPRSLADRLLGRNP